MAEPQPGDAIKSDMDLKALIVREIANAESARSEASKKLTKALQYYQGDMPDVPSEDGRSKATDRTTADVVGWVLPGVMRVFTAVDHVAVCEPVGPEDEQWAKQATDGINYTFMKENDGYQIIYDATWDSLMGGDGIVKVFYDKTQKAERSTHSSLSDEQLAMLVQDDDVDVLNYSGPDNPENPSLDGLHWVTIQRKSEYTCTKVLAVAPEDYGRDDDALSCEEARFQFHLVRKTRSDLVEMGFDKEEVYNINKASKDTSEEYARDSTSHEGQPDPSMDLIDLYECYIRVDKDGDGIAELMRVYYAGTKGGGTILEADAWDDEQPFEKIPCTPMPHRFESGSLADETMDVQRIKTALLRAALDNTYASNNPQRFATGTIKNPDELFAPSFGGVVFGDAGTTLETLQVPFVAETAYNALAYQDQVIERRTGVSRTTMALDPDALQNQTATANQNAHDAAYSQIELIARNQAELGWKKVFRKILRLEVKHQDRPRTIRMRGEFVEIDPRHWNADMDVTINVGLGTGSRDRDMRVLQTVLGNQTMLAQQVGQIDPMEGVKMLPFIVNTMKKQAEAAGIKNADEFYPTYGQQEMQALAQRMAERAAQPDPKVQAEMKKVEVKAAGDQQKTQAKAANDQQKLFLEFQNDQTKQLHEAQMDEAKLLQKERQIDKEIELKRETALMSAITKTATSPVRVGGQPG